MNVIKRQARIAGLLYFVVLLVAPIGLIYVPGQLYVRGNATATADHMRTSESLVRVGITSELVHEVLWVFVVLALYRLLKSVDETNARLMLIFGALLSVPIVFINVLNEIAAMILVSGTDYFAAFDKRQLDALAFLFFRLHGQGLMVASIFWGIWLFPFGLLVIRSGFMPQHGSFVERIAGILELGELPIIFWLLIWGARTPRSQIPIVPATGSKSRGITP